MAEKPGVQFEQRPAQDQKIGECIADENGPQKIFGSFEKAMQLSRRRLPDARQPAHVQTAERKYARLHARKQERDAQTQRQQNKIENLYIHLQEDQNSKFQVPKKFQVSNSKSVPAQIGAWNLVLPWNLKLGTWNFI